MSRAYNVAAITAVALKDNVDPNLAIADATVESNLNEKAVGDNGTSFGLFQLHQGGELGTLTQAQAFDPVTNATRALAQFENVQKSNPGITDPGTIAALAQRPANPVSYAAKVDSAMATANGTATAVNDSSTPAAPPGGGGLLSTTGKYLGTVGDLVDPLTAGPTVIGLAANEAGSEAGSAISSAAGSAGSATASAIVSGLKNALPDNALIRGGEIMAGALLGIVGVIAVAYTLGGKTVTNAAKGALDLTAGGEVANVVLKAAQGREHAYTSKNRSAKSKAGK